MTGSHDAGCYGGEAQSTISIGTASRRERERRGDAMISCGLPKPYVFTRGYHATTIDDVAVAAEVGKGTVYLYFDTKETILAHLLSDGLDALVTDLEASYAIDEALDAGTRLRRIAIAYLRIFPDESRIPIDPGVRSRAIQAATPNVYQDVLTRSLPASNGWSAPSSRRRPKA
ncbi:MAG: TetR/AcrR family transcriptional regulator [Anaerolineae bacterium]